MWKSVRVECGDQGPQSQTYEKREVGASRSEARRERREGRLDGSSGPGRGRRRGEGRRAGVVSSGQFLVTFRGAPLD